MTTELIVIAVIALTVGYLVATLKSEHGWRKELQRRNAQLEAELAKAKESPIGYNQMQAYDELIALAVGSEKRMQLLRELAVQYKRGNYNNHDE